MARRSAASLPGAAPLGLPLWLPLRALALLLLAPECRGKIAAELYCGADECYSLLELDRAAEAPAIKKAFRRLALQWHPDKNRGSRQAEDRFRRISRAHEVLSDEKLRRAYDYFLDHPEDSYTNYYRYYHARYAPQTPVWAVVCGTLLFLSGLQYINAQWRYTSVMGSLKLQPRFVRRVAELLEEEAKSYTGKLSKAEREVLRDRVELRVIETEVQHTGSGSSKPRLRSLVIVKAALLPLTLLAAAHAFILWHWRFTWKQESYGEEERASLMRWVLGIPEGAWGTLEEAQQVELVERRLWEPEQMQAYREEQEEEMAQKRAQSGAYKRAKRWMRKH